ncbi:MAG TPA: phospholipase A2 [Ilumatobacteraceae bacterium]|mgnify:CR=1 FL=1|nr:phospholipase A2 [Ilumatobacteraceae bacterium]
MARLNRLHAVMAFNKEHNMRFRLAVLVAVTSVLTVVSPVAAGPSTHTARNDWAYVQQELYQVPLRTFVATSTAGDLWFDWSNDGCSAPLVGDTGMSFNFRDPCRRHDFGYRNLKLLERRYGSGATYWNSTNRRAVDRQFLADMKAHCHGRALTLRVQCYSWAQTYYAAVRIAGGP